MKRVHSFTSFLLIVSISWFLTLNQTAFAQECDPSIEKQPNGGSCSDNDACKCESGVCVNGTCAENVPNE